MGKTKGIGRGKNPNSKKALIANQVKKGGPGKPNAGRPMGSLSLKDRMAKFNIINIPVEMPDGSITNQEMLDAIIFSLYTKARTGDTAAIKEVFDRNFGKEPEKLEIDDKELRKTVDEIKDAATLQSKHDRPY